MPEIEIAENVRQYLHKYQQYSGNIRTLMDLGGLSKQTGETWGQTSFFAAVAKKGCLSRKYAP